ncbi:ATP-binding cassette domain-containing protein [Natronosporangium hydrolyticum]|uniref:ATP-binding cassette domain-containing protein n=1 Tax=Natronosporangium hydrolyticum TaxID=2811111 RepID=A0A895YDY6_9ACTN|nr:ATP-binding cassette domain-containing protein [Natronosporangium hydrolyticum]QSB16024.1 ATP-binding cassette domain-containing protein [Natronosporangium hydrolyticum]
MTTENAIEITGLRKSFGSNEVLKGVDLTVRRGSMLALLGPNGAGKSTLVKILSTLSLPDGGDIRVNGYDVVKERSKVRAEIGLTNQFVALDWMHTGRENLVMLGRLYHLSKADAKRRAAELLEQFDLNELADKRVKIYSGGNKRRLDLAACLIVRPSIIFLDEPTTGLDPRSRAVMWKAIQQLLADGTTILLTTQYLEEADALADKIAVIDGGTVIAEGSAETLKQRVGKDRLELVFADINNYSKALGVVEGESLLSDDEALRIGLVSKGPRHVKQMLDLIDQHGIEVESFALTTPTLDDVFFALTNRTAHATPEEVGVAQ